MITLTAVPGADGQWDVSEDGRELGTWQRTEHGATFSDSAGSRLATIDAVGGASPCAVVASEGRDAGQWSDIAHKILAGQCEIREAHDVAPATVPTCEKCGQPVQRSWGGWGHARKPDRPHVVKVA